MQEQEVEIEITAQGKVLIRTKGIKGARCLDVAEFFAQIVGREESRELTGEYYETAEVVQRHTQAHQRRS
ncbi:MAG TPA: DUF2997 domain-containing protein [Pirellulales bacterium]|nr:DUF2997 domain-containing protein [Pirellulales bacterium]